MDIFNEIYGKYYQLIAHILTLSMRQALELKDISSIIQHYGFEESNLYLEPMIVDPSNKDYVPLLNSNSETSYTTSLLEAPTRPLSNLEKQWLKAIINDTKFQLFFDHKETLNLLKELEEVEPLFDPDFVRDIRVARDGDPYEQSSYQGIFRGLLKSIEHKQLIKVYYYNREGQQRRVTVAPYKLEYSLRNDKFRLTSATIDRGEFKFYSKINVARIIRFEVITEGKYPEGVGEFIQSTKSKTPISIELSNIRNGFDRFFIEFSNYERIATYNEDKNTCHIQIFYYSDDELELLIKLMSFGPIVKVLGPEVFRDKFIERLKSQLDF